MVQCPWTSRPGIDYHLVVLQVTENGFVNVGTSKKANAIKIK